MSLSSPCWRCPVTFRQLADWRGVFAPCAAEFPLPPLTSAPGDSSDKAENLAPGDGTHPAMPEGARKVAKLLLNFFKTDPFAKRWFTADSPVAPASK